MTAKHEETAEALGRAVKTASMPTHHLSDELLLDYAAGTCDEAVSLLVATHLTLCPSCRARAESMDALGGAMLDALDPTPIKADSLEQLMARLDAPDAVEPRPIRDDRAALSATAGTRDAGATRGAESHVLPRVLQDYVGESPSAIAWTPLGLGVEQFELPVSGKTRAIMLRVPAGRAVPQHTHEGNEYVIVLQGAFEDAFGRFARGDVEIADAAVDHRPVADQSGDCICLAVMDAPLRLTSLFGRALNRFVSI